MIEKENDRVVTPEPVKSEPSLFVQKLPENLSKSSLATSDRESDSENISAYTER